MRVAIVHYWLLGMRGGERVLEELCNLYPDADIFTLFYDETRVSPTIRKHRVNVSGLNRLRRFHRSLLPLMPMALESFDLRGYDVVITSESGPAKGVLTSSSTRHICYCHSPMRYLWELYPAYLHDWTRSSFKRALMRPLANYLRLWDFASAARVDEFIANSDNVRQRIWKTYRRQSTVIHPPVAVEEFRHQASEGYFLVVSELVAYKQIDYAVRYFSDAGIPLRVVGDGPELGSLRKMAGQNVDFLGRLKDEELRDQYARCRAFIMPGEEDFGITMVEALASGKPVIAFGRGGAREIVSTANPCCGLLYDEPSETGLAKAFRDFEALEGSIDPRLLRNQAQQFSREAFRSSFEQFMDNSVTTRAVPAKQV